ncbi:MAG: hypothetical protein JWM98_1093 [Thermoleophilia bacterium]|nr:hypothetical protein [Thermoleophilia bacterium]
MDNDANGIVPTDAGTEALEAAMLAAVTEFVPAVPRPGELDLWAVFEDLLSSRRTETVDATLERWG